MEPINLKLLELLIQTLTTVSTFTYITPGSSTVVSPNKILEMTKQIDDLKKIYNDYVGVYQKQLDELPEMIKNITKEVTDKV